MYKAPTIILINILFLFSLIYFSTHTSGVFDASVSWVCPLPSAFQHELLPGILPAWEERFLPMVQSRHPIESVCATTIKTGLTGSKLKELI